MLKFYTLFILLFFLFGCNTEDSSSSPFVEITKVNLPIAEKEDIVLNINERKKIMLRGVDEEDKALSFKISKSPENGILEGTPPYLTYTPFTNFTGNDIFYFNVDNGMEISKEASVSLVIKETNDFSFVRVSGKITYDSIGTNSNYKGLDYNTIVQLPSKNVVVEAVNTNNETISNTQTDDNGEYFFNVKAQSIIKIRVSARIFHIGESTWDMKVVDNTNNQALYVIEGNFLTVGMSDSFRDLHAPFENRVASPFAILDTVYKGVQMIVHTDNTVTFPPLLINWSTKNISTDGNVRLGQIGTSNYDEGELFILGDIQGDFDEYDTHVVAHEWGHYYENTFSRTDSIGGNHGANDRLDIRVAFSEGFGNAFAGMVLNDPHYFDSIGENRGFFFNLELSDTVNAGWFNEASIGHILYDIYDNNSDGRDNLSLGFSPIHTVLSDYQKNISAVTSIFPFITGLKALTPEKSTLINSLLSSENIAPINDDYGKNRSNSAEDYPYINLKIGKTTKIILSSKDGSFNKLSNIKFLTFTLNNAKSYKITLQQTNGLSSDPDFYLYRATSSDPIVAGDSINSGKEEKEVFLSSGDYILEVRDDANRQKTELSVLIK